MLLADVDRGSQEAAGIISKIDDEAAQVALCQCVECVLERLAGRLVELDDPQVPDPVLEHLRVFDAGDVDLGAGQLESPDILRLGPENFDRHLGTRLTAQFLDRFLQRQAVC